MGDKPAPELTLERRDNNGIYEPGNCYWTTRWEQAQNKRSTGIQKLTPKQVVAIRADPRLYREISKDYGISKGHISEIKSGKTWFHLLGVP